MTRSVVSWFYSTECQELNGAVRRDCWRIIFALSATEIEPHENRQCVLSVRGNSHEGQDISMALNSPHKLLISYGGRWGRQLYGGVMGQYLDWWSQLSPLMRNR